jgi:subtilisin family serine protease
VLKRCCVKRAALACVCAAMVVLLAPFLRAQSNKKRVTSEADLPRFSYPVKGAASALLQADEATFNAFASKVRADLDNIFNNYEIDDKATLRTLIGVKFDLEELAGDYSSALQTLEQLRSLQEKPAAKLTTGLAARAQLQAIIETKSRQGPAFDAAFTKHFREAVNALPWDIVEDWAKRSYVSARLATEAVVLGDVMTEIDPAVEKSGALDNADGWDVVETREEIKFSIPLGPLRAPILKDYIAAHNVTKPDIWAAREVTLTEGQKLTPVVIAIWDSGIDLSDFPDQTFTDPHATASGAHGLAFDDHGAPSTSYLYPLTSGQLAKYGEFRAIENGRLDIEDGKDSPDAQEAEKIYRTSTPEQLHQVFEMDDLFGFYVHGTHCAGIAARGNPAARLAVARFNDQLPDYPFPPTVEWTRKLGADFQEMSDFFRTRHVRVVNMSWGDDPQEFEEWLSKTGEGADPVEREKHADELYAIWRNAVESAIKDAPDTLFITAAGNSNSNAAFLQDVPASLHLPNLIAVGAVDQAGEETSFTSYGDTVVVDADGYEVKSYIPGGAKMKLSGTSMASPNVVNLAAKLFALDPSLTPKQVIDLIERGATTSEGGRLHLIDEKRSVALLQQQKGGQ